MASEGFKLRSAPCLRFSPRSVPGSGPLDPLRGLQNAMREAEAELAEDDADGGRARACRARWPADLLRGEGPVVGMIKRQNRAYLVRTRRRSSALLGVGERTPIFKLGEQRLERFSWYLRLAGPAPDRRHDGRRRPPRDGDGRRARGRPAPRRSRRRRPAAFRQRAWADPRAPQNLYPVGAARARAPSPARRRDDPPARLERPCGGSNGLIRTAAGGHGPRHGRLNPARVVGRHPADAYLQLDDVVVVETPVSGAAAPSRGVVDMVRAQHEGSRFDSDVFLAEEGLLPVQIARAPTSSRPASSRSSRCRPSRATSSPRAAPTATRLCYFDRMEQPARRGSRATGSRSTSTSPSSTGAAART